MGNVLSRIDPLTGATLLAGATALFQNRKRLPPLNGPAWPGLLSLLAVGLYIRRKRRKAREAKSAGEPEKPSSVRQLFNMLNPFGKTEEHLAADPDCRVGRMEIIAMGVTACVHTYNQYRLVRAAHRRSPRRVRPPAPHQPAAL